MLRIYIGFQVINSIVFSPPHFYCLSLLLLLLLLLLILLFSILRPLVSFFFATRFYKRLPTAIFSSFWSNVSCSEQESWFSSAVSWLPCLSSPVSFKDSYSTTTTCTSPSLIQYIKGHIPIPEENKRIMLPYKDALLDLASPNVPYKTKNRVLVQKGSGFFYWRCISPCCFNFRISKRYLVSDFIASNYKSPVSIDNC